MTQPQSSPGKDKRVGDDTWWLSLLLLFLTVSLCFLTLGSVGRLRVFHAGPGGEPDGGSWSPAGIALFVANLAVTVIALTLSVVYARGTAVSRYWWIGIGCFAVLSWTVFQFLPVWV